MNWRELNWRAWSWKIAALAITFVIALSTARGLRRGYETIGDNSLLELRGFDVLRTNHPWLGTWTSASLSSGVDMNNPGPLLFDVMALPIRLFGGPAGVAIGIATLNIVVVWLVGWVTYRIGGATASLTALTITAGLVWTLGSELVYDPWQPNVLILTFWLVMVLVWATAADHVGMFPLLFGFATFALQTHLVFSYLVPVLLVFAVTCALARRWKRGPGRFADLRGPTRNSLIVLAVLWFQPLWEQFFGDGQGNMSRLLQTAVGGGSSESETTTTGLALAIRQMGAVLALPPFWGRGGFNTSIPGSTWIETPGGRVLSAPGLRMLGPALIGLVIVIALIALAWRTVRRSDQQYLVPAFWTLAVALTTGFVTLVITPIDILGLSPHKARWLWVFGAFTTYLLVMAVLTALTVQHRQRVLGVVVALGAVALVATIPTYYNPSGPVYFNAAAPAIADLRSQVDDYFSNDPDAPDAVLFDPEGMGFAEPYTSPVMAQLAASGVDLYVESSSLVRQIGNGRQAPADLTDSDGQPLPLVYVRAGQEALDDPPGAVRIAFHDGELTPFTLNDVTDRAVGVFLVPAADR